MASSRPTHPEQQELRAEKPTEECPVCENEPPPPPPAGRPGLLLCPLHGHKLSLFCLDDGRLACVACRDEHRKHRFEPVGEAARHRREELRELLKPLKKRAEVFDEALDEGGAHPDRTEKQRRDDKLRETEAGVRQAMESLFGFLRCEERRRVGALREEATRKSRATEARMAGLSGDAAALADAVRAVDDQLRDEDDASFLREYRPAEERLALTLEDPRPVSGALVDVAGHLGNLAFKVWLKMKDAVPYCPVVLDPNTAGPGLTVSRDLSMIGKEFWSVPVLDDDGAPERRTTGGDQDTVGHNVLGAEGVSSGTHGWAVDAGGCDRWVLGVLSDDYRRSGDSEGGFWEIMRYDNKYMALSSQGSTYLAVRDLQRVRVQLDCERGRLSFYDCDSDAHLHTFTHAFTGTLFPLFYNGDHGASLRLLPGRVRVTLENHT